MGNTQHLGSRAAEGLGGRGRKRLVSRDSLQIREQSRLRRYRENNPGDLADTFYQRSHGSVRAEGEEFWGQGYG